MHRRGVLARLVLSLALAFGVVASSASPAGAHISEGCSAEAVFPDGTVVDPAAGDEFTVPRSGAVDWVGRIGDGTAETEPRRHSGRAEVQLPPLADTILGLFRDDTEPDVRTWGDDDATTTFDEGRSRYDIPSWVPAGAKVRVEAIHIDPEQNCDGWVVLVLDGTPFSSPTTLIAIAGIIASLIGLAVALRAQPGTYDPVRGRPIVGFIAGGFLGAFLAPLLWALGVIGLESVAWPLLPIVGAGLGTVGGLYPPFNRPSGGPPGPDRDDGPEEPILADAPGAPHPAVDLGPAGATRTLSELEGDAGDQPPAPPAGP